jgi:8-hydroxy-5-deazaflavin:NADPH oxidoreductase
MKVGVLGSGDVGRSLGRGFVRHGHEVMVGSRTPEKLATGIRRRNPQLFVGHTDSLGERVQRWVAAARVVKAFNTVNNALMADPDVPGGPPTMFLCGNDADAKATVGAILDDFGWEPADIGPIERSRALEEMCIAWTAYGFESGRRDHAFKLLHR